MFHNRFSQSSSASEPNARSYASLDRVPAELLAEFNEQQLQTIEHIVAITQPKPAPKLVDLRININLIWQRFYLVLFIGKDRRQHQRSYVPKGIAKIGNMIAALTILASFNLALTCLIAVILLITRTWLGIDALPGMQLIDNALTNIS